MSSNNYYWFCPHCNCEVGAYNVTFEETCAHCGWSVEERKVEEDEVKDDYHTMNELYQHRHVLLALACNMIHKHNTDAMTEVFKAKEHLKGEMFDGMFIVMGYLNGKQFSYHVENKYWGLFKIPEQYTSDEWDGHSSDDVIDRIKDFIMEVLV